jgi:hypothetical protein
MVSALIVEIPTCQVPSLGKQPGSNQDERSPERRIVSGAKMKRNLSQSRRPFLKSLGIALLAAIAGSRSRPGGMLRPPSNPAPTPTVSLAAR